MTETKIPPGPDRRFRDALYAGKVPRTLTMAVPCAYCGAPAGVACKDPVTGRRTELLAHPSRAEVAGVPPLRRRLMSLVAM